MSAMMYHHFFFLSVQMNFINVLRSEANAFESNLKMLIYLWNLH